MAFRISIFLFFIFLIMAFSQIGFCQDSATIEIMNDSLSNLNKKIDSIDWDSRLLWLKTETEIRDEINKIKSVIYNRGVDEVEGQKSSLSLIAGVGSLFLAIISLLFGVMMYLTQRSRDKMDEEVNRIRELRGRAEKEVDNIKENVKEFNNLIEEASPKIGKPIIDANKKAEDKKITASEEKIKLINEEDAEKSIEEYEKLLMYMQQNQITKDELPLNLIKNVALNFMKLKRFRDAIVELEQYLKSFPMDETSMFGASYCYDELGEFEMAKYYINKVTQVNPSESEAFYNYGIILTHLYDKHKKRVYLDDAIKKYDMAIKLNEEYYDAYYNYADALISLYHLDNNIKHLEEAKSKLTKFIEINPDDKSSYYNLACVESLLGNKKAMLDALKIAINYNSNEKKNAIEDEDFEKYKIDPEFQKLVEED